MTETMRLRSGMERHDYSERRMTADIDGRRYRTMEAAANRLQKEAKGYLDSLRGWW